MVSCDTSNTWYKAMRVNKDCTSGMRLFHHADAC